jgi:serine/threonine protein kinase
VSPAEAQAIAGRYRLERRLGSGGMSTVNLALDLRLERYVAVKLLAEHLADDPAFVSRFEREAQAAARLIHPHVVQIFDSGLDDRTGQHFIVMEYIEGRSCAEILRDQGWVPVPEAVAIIEQACAGLHYAHRHGVIHRDVKPGNLLRSAEGEVKLADFGIAKAAEQSSITQVGSVLGTAAYLAPEQARGEEAGPQADLYALGVVAYQLISGRLPYEAASLTELVLKQQEEQPPRLDELVAGVTPQLAEAVAVALAIDPRERFADASQMASAVVAGAAGVSAPGTGERTRAQRGAPFQATSILAAGAIPAQRRGSAPETPVAPLRPRRQAPGAYLPPEPMPAPAPKRGRGARRAAMALLLLIALAGAAVGAAVATAPQTKVTLRRVLYQDAGKVASALRELVSENTR